MAVCRRRTPQVCGPSSRPRLPFSTWPTPVHSSTHAHMHTCTNAHVPARLEISRVPGCRARQPTLAHPTGRSAARHLPCGVCPPCPSAVPCCAPRRPFPAATPSPSATSASTRWTSTARRWRMPGSSSPRGLSLILWTSRSEAPPAAAQPQLSRAAGESMLCCRACSVPPHVAREAERNSSCSLL